MTVLDHIKQLAVALTGREKQELTDYLSGSEAAPLSERPKSLRGDWRRAFSPHSILMPTLEKFD